MYRILFLSSVGFIIGFFIALKITSIDYNKQIEKMQEKHAQSISECLNKPSVHNSFTHDIKKNKQGQIVINTAPKIETELTLKSIDSLIKHTIQKPTKKPKKKYKKGNWK